MLAHTGIRRQTTRTSRSTECTSKSPGRDYEKENGYGKYHNELFLNRSRYSLYLNNYILIISGTNHE